MDWRVKVELFEEIRREYEFGIGAIAGVAEKLGVHRRMVREAIGCALPKLRKTIKRPRFQTRLRDRVYRWRFGSRSEGAPQTAPHRAADLGTDQGGVARLPDLSANCAAVCAQP